MGLTVSPLVASDRAPIEEMLVACDPVFSEVEIAVALDLIDEAVRGEYTALSAVLDGKTVGYCLAGPTPLTVDTWHLYWICVHPSAQRSRIASALQTALEDVIRKAGGARIVLETGGRADYHAAKRFYQSVGYIPVGRIEDYYKPGDACIFFCKVL